MFRRFSFKFKIIGIMLALLGLVTVIGVYAYQQFSSLVTSISNDVQPNTLLVTSKTLMSDIGEAENSAKSFSLTKDTIYLDRFYKVAEDVDDRLFEMHFLGDKMDLPLIQLDSLDTLISEKFKLLNQLLVIQDQFRVQVALDKVVKRIEKDLHVKPIKENNDIHQKDSNDLLDVNQELNQNKTKSILSWLFKKEKVEADKSQTLTPNKSDTVKSIAIKPNEKIKLLKINKGLEEVKEEEKIIEKSIKNKELELILADKKVTNQINQILDGIEDSELLRIANQAELAKIAMKNTNRQIALFCIVMGVLLLFMAYVIINYITNNNKYRKVLKKAKEQAEALAFAKEKFLANMSHEIRTPMNAISGFTEQMSKGELSKEQAEHLAMVRKSVDHLLYLINDVLDYTKLQARKLKLETIGFRLNEVVEDVVMFVTPLVKEKQLDIKCEFHTEADLVLLGDPYRLRQILLNLLNNAIKFTPKGSITIKVTNVMQNNENTFLRFEIIDTGIGMNKNHLEKVFEEFEQAEDSITRNYGGTGLGLSIVKMLVELHKGKVDLQSKINVGTTISFEIPYLKGTVKDLEFEKESINLIEQTLPDNLKILIVDDSEFNRKLLITILKKYNIFYTEAETGLQAIKEVKLNDYDLVLMDARMPEMNGLEASQKIRKLPDSKNSKIPIIALTAAVTREDRIAYQKAGMNGFLAKPFKEEELILEINSILKVNVVDNKTPVEKKKEQQHVDFEELKNLSSGDKKFYIDMLQTFLDSTNDGLNDMNSAMEVGDWGMVAEYAHKVCSPCKHLSADVLYEYLKSIELNCRNNKELDSIPGKITKSKLEFEKIAAEIRKELNNTKQ